MEGVQVVGNSQCSVAFREQDSLQVSLEHGQRRWRRDEIRQTVPHSRSGHGKRTVADGGQPRCRNDETGCWRRALSFCVIVTVSRRVKICILHAADPSPCVRGAAVPGAADCQTAMHGCMHTPAWQSDINSASLAPSTLRQYRHRTSAPPRISAPSAGLRPNWAWCCSSGVA